jgi:hypothetical protein
MNSLCLSCAKLPISNKDCHLELHLCGGREDGMPHAKVRSGQAAGGAELGGSSATTSAAVGGGGGGDRQEWSC